MGENRSRNAKENVHRSSNSRPSSASLKGSHSRPYKSGRQDRTNSNQQSQHEVEQLRNENKQLREERDGVKQKLDGIQAEHEEISSIARDIEKERDFYFSKVVAIENILKAQHNQEAPLLKAVYELLYQTEEDQAQQTQHQEAQQEQQQQQQQMDDVGM